ncbi:hypothetical protein FOZ60_010646 [Perkinsus olseni]|uniref:Uncharacterized protein n=1 Tax=Perkinsus olseni TaxID=32597 RepID=A0A7J6NEZ2_PEROL|nr:hypothetical protein FOZ60_010646 [Perkinsus olseni]
MPGRVSPLLVGPFEMVTNILTGCLKFDNSDYSRRGLVASAFRRLSKELGRGIYGYDVEVCYSPLGTVELVIEGLRYPLALSSVPKIEEWLRAASASVSGHAEATNSG